MENAIGFKYEFRGYRLLKASIDRYSDKPLKNFTIRTRKNTYDEKNHIYETVTEITILFGDETSKYVFSSGFLIHDLEWLEVMAEQTVLNELFAVSFPYFRSKISEFTSDFRPGFMIPTFDLSRIDFTKSVTFNLEIRKVNPESNENNSNLVN